MIDDCDANCQGVSFISVEVNDKHISLVRRIVTACDMCEQLWKGASQPLYSYSQL